MSWALFWGTDDLHVFPKQIAVDDLLAYVAVEGYQACWPLNVLLVGRSI